MIFYLLAFGVPLFILVVADSALLFITGWSTVDFLVGGFKCSVAQAKHSRSPKDFDAVLQRSKEKHERLSLCKTCVFQEQGICSLCDCILDEKAGMSDEGCPMEFWERGEVDSCALVEED